MANTREVVVLSAVRTAIGRYGGTLKTVPLTKLAALVTREAVTLANVEAAAVDHVIFGNVLHTATADPYLARVAAIEGGLPIETPALTVNRLCGSGLQALVSAAQLIQCGDARLVVAGGAESMSQVPYWLPAMRWGQRHGDARAIDALAAALSDPFESCHMGITAENIARRYGISREEQDALALQSHQRAVAAIGGGRFLAQIVPVEVPSRTGLSLFVTDEQVRPDTSVAALAKLAPAFDPAGSVTAGNAAGLNDGAAALVLADAAFAAERGLPVLARLAAYGFAGVEPAYMGLGPVPAVRRALQRAGRTVADMDVIELNEAFAAQALAVMRDLDLPPERTNPNGSGVALGHPVGATGAILAVKAIHELRITGGRHALVTLCIGGGQGIAAVFEAAGA